MAIHVFVPDAAESAALHAVLAQRLALVPLAGERPALVPEDVVWIHAGTAADAAASFPAPALLAAVRAHLEGGGRVLLTGPAAILVGSLTDEEQPPELLVGTWAADTPADERRGVMALPGHPLFHRFPGGVYLHAPRAGAPRAEAVYRDGRRPARGALLGVEKAPIACDPDRGLLFEHAVAKGRVVALGAHLVFASDDVWREHRARFAGDLIDWLSRDAAAVRGRAWPAVAAGVRVLGDASLALPCPAAGAPDDDGAVLDVPVGRDAFFDLVHQGGHALYGSTRAGAQEVWAFPFRAFQWHVSLGPVGSDAAGAPAADVRPTTDPEVGVRARVHPRWFARECELRGVRLRERIATWTGGFHFVYENSGTVECALLLQVRADQRLFWPYPPGLLGPLEACRCAGGRGLAVRDAVLGLEARLVCDTEPQAFEVRDASDGRAGVSAAHVLLGFTLAPGERVAVFVSGGARDRMPAPGTPASVARGGLELHFDDPEPTRLAALVRCRARDFFLRYDGASAGYVAGHGMTRPGFGASRPGYAWYFGRDALFFAHAALAYGDRDEAAQALALLARFQDPEGKILHELTPAGVVHFDAADAAPMFVDAVGRWFAWSRDLDGLRALWPAVERALRWLRRADRDGDGVAENTLAGHGWMEGGPLREGVHVETYLAAFQARAWLAGAFLAEALGDAARAAECAAHASRVRHALEERFRAADGTRFVHALRADGSRDTTGSVLTVLPALLQVTEPERAAGELAPFATHRLQADWGSRIVGTDHPAYDPASYQAGSVWPLFTGWTTLADLIHGRPDPAWVRLVPLLRSCLDFAPGLVDEVFRGDTYTPRGICAHQAWSHSAILSALAEGVLGARPLPDRAEVVLEPTLPGGLDRLRFTGLRIGATLLDGTLQRDAAGGAFHIELVRVAGADLADLEVAPYFAAPAAVDGVSVAGAAVEFARESLGDGFRLRVRVPMAERVHVAFLVREALLVDLRPAPLVQGQASHGLRILGRQVLPDGAVELRFEGPAGAHAVPVRCPGGPPHVVEGAELAGGALRFAIAGAALAVHAVRLRFA
ncbi:MAG: hypothetical protein IT458_15645 [Planctomycetes bacterium]|nr:hypothetical protein [Planctomycetota bacterium]